MENSGKINIHLIWVMTCSSLQRHLSFRNQVTWKDASSTIGLDISMTLQLEKTVTVPKSQIIPKFLLPTVYGMLMMSNLCFV